MIGIVETAAEFLGLVLVSAVVYSATQTESPREIARRAGRLFVGITLAISILAGGVSLISAL